VVKSRVLVIGMDSAPLSLMLPWISKGFLPTFGKIFSTGSYGDLYSRIPVTPVAWSSIYTGNNPARHGIMGFRNQESGTYGHQGVNSTIRDGRDVWEVAGSHGKKVVVVNTPLTYPPREVNGYLVCGFMAPSPDYEFTYPPSLKEEVLKIAPKYRIGTPPFYIKGIYLKELHSTVHMVGEVAAELMKKIDWDLAFVVFKETDEVQHSFYDRPEAMLGLYQRVDTIAGELIRLAGESAYVFVVSDHGGEPVEKRFNVAEFLRRSGYLTIEKTRPTRSTTLLQTAATTVFDLKMQWFLDLPGSRDLLRRVMRLLTKSADGSGAEEGFYAGKVDWAKTSVFISSGIGLRINLKGREPNGMVEPEDFEKIRDKVVEEFREVRDPDTGMTVFKKVLPREAVLSGPHSDIAPDILCLPNTGYLPTESLASFDPLAVVATHRTLFSRSTLWSGTHSPNGLIAIRGPGVVKTSISDATLDDVAPTILYAMGLPVLKGVDGKVLTQVFDPAHMLANPITREEETFTSKVKPMVLSAEEERKVEDRLKDLGYLG